MLSRILHILTFVEAHLIFYNLGESVCRLAHIANVAQLARVLGTLVLAHPRCPVTLAIFVADVGLEEDYLEVVRMAKGAISDHVYVLLGIAATSVSEDKGLLTLNITYPTRKRECTDSILHDFLWVFSRLGICEDCQRHN